MWHWISCNSSALLVVLTALTLIVLFVYALDTKRIARASVTQVENSQVPFVGVVKEDLPPHSGWQLRNQGFGPALNVKCSFIQGRDIPSIATGEFFMVQNEFPSVVAGAVEAEIKYESLSGFKYQTLITWEAGAMKTSFKRLK